MTGVQIAVAPLSKPIGAGSKLENFDIGHKILFSCRLEGVNLPKKLVVNWNRTGPIGFDEALKRYRHYLQNHVYVYTCFWMISCICLHCYRFVNPKEGSVC